MAKTRGEHMPYKYIILDSNCFLYALRHENCKLNMREIIDYAHQNKSYLTISAYSLYEIIQGLNDLDEISLFRKQLLELGDFWVTSTNSILDCKGIEYGFDFLFSLSLHNNELLRDFGEKRDVLREKVYGALFRKMFFYAVLVTSAYLVLNNSNSAGKCDPDTLWKVQYISNHFFEQHKSRYMKVFSEIYKHVGLPSYDPIEHEFFRDYNAKESLREIMLNLFVEILAVSEVELSLAKKEWMYNSHEYNNRIIDKCKILSSEIKYSSFKEVNKQCSKRTNKRITIDYVLEQLLSDFPASLKKESYCAMVKKLFISGGFGEKFNNDFIDLSNLILLDRFPEGTAVYITEESFWKNVLFSNQNSINAKNSVSFYNKFLVNQ